jgi:xanthine dehydrogenase molybdopterin-binding subunit B
MPSGRREGPSEGHRFGEGTTTKFPASQPAHRTEGARFLTGTGRYTDDINLPGQIHGIVVRSPFAHARIRVLSVEAAGAAPGVVAVGAPPLGRCVTRAYLGG